MATARFQITIPFDPPLPRNVVSNSIYLRDTIANEFPGSTDWNALANAVADAWIANWLGATYVKPITVKVYGTEGPPPHDPIATVARNPTAAPITPFHPSQKALCLSFRGGLRPWQRGRIYLAPWMALNFTSASSEATRPSTALQDMALALATALGNVGGVDIDWCVHSRTHGEDYPINYAWCDDSWDVVRRRKLAPTARRSVALSE